MHDYLGFIGPALAIAGILLALGFTVHGRSKRNTHADDVRNNLDLTVRRINSARHAGPRRNTFGDYVAAAHRNGDSDRNRTTFGTLGRAA